MLFIRKESFYERQLKLWEAKADEADFGSDDYWEAMEKVKQIHEYIKEEQISKKLNTSNLDTSIKALDVASKTGIALLSLGLSWVCFKKEFKAEESMELANNTAKKAKERFMPKL